MDVVVVVCMYVMYVYSVLCELTELQPAVCVLQSEVLQLYGCVYVCQVRQVWASRRSLTVCSSLIFIPTESFRTLQASALFLFSFHP